MNRVILLCRVSSDASISVLVLLRANLVDEFVKGLIAVYDAFIRLCSALERSANTFMTIVTYWTRHDTEKNSRASDVE